MKTATPPSLPVVDRTVTLLDGPDYPYRLQVTRAAYMGAYAWSIYPRFSGNARILSGRGLDQEDAEQAALDAIERQVLQLVCARRTDYTLPNGIYEGKPLSEIPRGYLEFLARRLRHADPRRIAAVAELARRAEQERLQPALTM